MQITEYSAEKHAPFVFGSWLSSYSQAPHVRRLHRDLYYAYQRLLISDLLRRGCTLVAEDNGLLLGFSCVERTGPSELCVHYVFTKPRDRRLGIAWALIVAAMGRLEANESTDTVMFSHAQEPFTSWAIRMGWPHKPALLSERNHNWRPNEP